MMQGQTQIQTQAQRQTLRLPLVSQNFKRIYQLIKANPSTKKDLTSRTKFPASLIDQATKKLSQYSLVKNIKRAVNKHLNVWVLYDYQEEEEGKIDQTEKDDLFDFVRKKDGPITMAQLQKDALKKGLKIDNLKEIVSVLEMRGELMSTQDKILPRKMKIINTPCLQCNLKDICSPDGPVSPTSCPYLLSW